MLSVSALDPKPPVLHILKVWITPASRAASVPPGCIGPVGASPDSTSGSPGSLETNRNHVLIQTLYFTCMLCVQAVLIRS